MLLLHRVKFLLTTRVSQLYRRLHYSFWPNLPQQALTNETNGSVVNAGAECGFIVFLNEKARSRFRSERI